MLLKTVLLALMIASPALSLPQHVAAGEKTKPRTERFASGYIDVLPGYKTERVVGPDFDVDYVIPEGARLKDADVMLGVYSGSFPGFSPPAKGVKTEAGTFGGKQLRWHAWKVVAGEKTTYRKEALVRLEGGQWVWHIFLAAPDERRLEELMGILKSYRAR
jgi:hypothetical protein